MIGIRKAKEEDFEEIKSLVIEINDIHAKVRPDLYDFTDDPITRNEFYELLRCRTNDVFIAIDLCNNKIVAYSILNIINNKCLLFTKNKYYGYIEEFCVKSNYKRRGIGKALFNYIKEYARELDLSSLQLTVWEFNEDARYFYESLGMITKNRRMEIEI